ncbi:Carboxylesterase [Streptomyces sp. YIM 121038]|uniref:carboxylesterase/lipase family protein n=1 Tax=Streptomyces sp. YIM 121038 TaxID=2136401 RepID=UPI00116222B7|nr:carboxylesterase family protein [Streptomyces sp. YIM 121038]QCX78679.1 Carboxylesterase [Streptomyces sp. YIM 121038]
MSDHTAIEAPTAYGPVSGRVVNDVATFLGIPYAAPMTGEARFAAPAPPEPWSEARPAHAFGATSPKPPFPGRLADLLTDPDIEGDDWLNLNVWTPDTTPDQPLPVFVWIHGGGFTNGSSAVPCYDGAAFARDGVVCVSLNYRLGVYGFGYLPDAETPANRGLLDQISALRWVRDNIAGFGGDPERVTVAGESAGAMSVLALLSAGVDLFQRAIVQSGTAHLGQTPEDAALVLGAVAERLGVPASAKALAEVPVARLIEEQNAVSGDVTKTASAVKYGQSTIDSCGMSFLPVVGEGQLLTQRPIDAIREQAGANVPLLVGSTVEEMRLFVTSNFMVGWDLPALFKPRLKAYGCPDGSYEKYDVDGPVYPRKAAPGVASAVLTDRMFRIPSSRVAEAREGGAAPTHLYEFGWRSPVAANNVKVALGACHSLDLPFAWDTLRLPENLKFTGPNPPQAAADALHAAWVGFAKGEEPGWPAYDALNRKVMSYAHDNTAEDKVVDKPREGERAWWDGHLN